MKTSISRILCGLVIAVAAVSAFAGAKEDIQADMQAGRWSQADSRLADVLAKHPDNALAHYWQAQVKYREGGKAWQEYRDKVYTRLVAEASPNGAWNQGYIGTIYTTAINLTILQLEDAMLPIYQR